MEPHDWLAKAGIRCTSQRLAVSAFLLNSSRPLEAKEIYRDLDGLDASVSMAAIYRILDLFAKSGLVERVPFPHQAAHYRLTNRTTTGELICSQCGKTEQLADSLELAAFKRNVVKDSNFASPEELKVYTSCRRDDCD